MTNRRRLAFVIHDLNSWGGHDRSTLEIARRLSHLCPVDVYSFTLNDPRGLGSWGEVRFQKIAPNLRHPVIARTSYFYAASLPMLYALPKIRGERVPLVHATGACSLVSDIVQVQFVNAAWKQAMKRLDPDVYKPPRGRTGNRFLSVAVDLYHGVMLNYDMAVEKAVYKRGKRYIAISRGVADELREHFGLNEEVSVIHHGVDADVFSPSNASPSAAQDRVRIRRELGIAEEEVAIIFVGAYERKGLARAIDALNGLDSELRSKARLIAVGSGNAEGFRARAAKLGLENRVSFVQHTREIVPYYRASDLFFLPTLYEPFGLVILEAMSCGLPVLASKRAGASELVVPGESGVLIEDPLSVPEMAGKLARLLRDPELRVRMGVCARRVAEAQTWDRVAEKYWDVIGPRLADSTE